MVKEKLCWDEESAVLHCWRKAHGEHRLHKDVLLSMAGLAASPTWHSWEAVTALGWGAKKKPPKTPPSAWKKKKRGQKDGERRWGVCGHVWRRENAGGAGVSMEPSRGQAVPGATGQTKASPTERYQVKKIPYFLYIATTRELRKYTVGGISTTKEPIAVPHPLLPR